MTALDHPSLLAALAGLPAIPALPRSPDRDTPTTALAPGLVHLWYVFYDDLRDPALLARYSALMSPEERARNERFVFAKDRHQHLVTRALVRTTLSRYAPVAAADWQFAANSYGRPEITGPAAAFDLCFNLSNTAGLIVCAVSRGPCELGVDVEDITRPGELVGIADHYFAPHEVRALRALPPDPVIQHRRFFAYWTLKESYIKARGMGLSIPLAEFAFELDRDPPITMSTSPLLGDSAEGWQFALLTASPRHMLAVAGRFPKDQPLRLMSAPCVP